MASAYGGLPTIVMVYDFCADAPEASVTVNVKEEVPATAGMPEIVPLVAPSVRPLGRVPARVQVYGGVPLLAVPGVEPYATPTFPFGIDAAHATESAELTVMAYDRCAVAAHLSAMDAVKVNCPAAVGVPVINPVLSIVKPAGLPV